MSRKIFANDDPLTGPDLEAAFVGLELFEQRAATTTGLTFGYGPGRIRDAAGDVIQVAAGTVALTDNATNYVEVNSSGVVAVSATRTLAKKPIYKVVTVSGAITTVTNERCGFDFS